MYNKIKKRAKELFGTMENYSKEVGYTGSNAGWYIRRNINKLNNKLRILGLELDIKEIEQ